MPLFHKSKPSRPNHKAAKSTSCLPSSSSRPPQPPAPAPPAYPTFQEYMQSTTNLQPPQQPWPMTRPVTSPGPNAGWQQPQYPAPGPYHHPQMSTPYLAVQPQVPAYPPPQMAPMPYPSPYQAPPVPQLHSRPSKTGLHAAWKSCANLSGIPSMLEDAYDDFQHMTNGSLRGLLNLKLDDVITLIDDDKFGGTENELAMLYQPQPQLQQPRPQPSQLNLKPGEAQSKQPSKKPSIANLKQASKNQIGTNYFAKASLYANSRLPPNLAPLKIYITTYPLLSLAAQYSNTVYTRPVGPEATSHVSADLLSGTKAMILKSIPLDDQSTIVFAIRGSQTFFDWAVNLRAAPTSPKNFLDDEGNLCHAGFLHVARKMVKPVAKRLRELLQERPGRSQCSLLITGHSAGGAVAALLYMHMLSSTISSDLINLTSCFRRIHCITFGAPPISLLPLLRPDTYALRKSIFFAFINEGDPVVRADRAYIKSLLDLYCSPVPNADAAQQQQQQQNQQKPHLPPRPSTSSKLPSKHHPNFHLHHHPNNNISTPQPQKPIWPLPDSLLCVAGKPILLRPTPASNSTPPPPQIEAVITSDAQLRTTVFGDPVMHMMRVYEERVRGLAVRAVLGGGEGASLAAIGGSIGGKGKGKGKGKGLFGW